MKAIKLYLGLDVHKDSITIAIAPAGRSSEIRLYGTITHDFHALEKALARIRLAHPGARLQVAYEAGPCGFGIARRLKQLEITKAKPTGVPPISVTCANWSCPIQPSNPSSKNIFRASTPPRNASGVWSNPCRLSCQPGAWHPPWQR